MFKDSFAGGGMKSLIANLTMLAILVFSFLASSFISSKRSFGKYSWVRLYISILGSIRWMYTLNTYSLSTIASGSTRFKMNFWWPDISWWAGTYEKAEWCVWSKNSLLQRTCRLQILQSGLPGLPEGGVFENLDCLRQRYSYYWACSWYRLSPT